MSQTSPPLGSPRLRTGTNSQKRQRLFVYNGGLLWQNKQVRRILQLAGSDIRLGLPNATDYVGVWGQSPTAYRGERVSAARNAPLLRVEDAFLRGLHPGRSGEPPLGVLLDKSGLHFDPRQPSDLETLLATHPLDDAALMQRARTAITRLKAGHLTKYSAVDPDIDPPPPGYVLVIDQTRNDASVTASGGNRAAFLEMLVFAQEEHPGRPVIIKTHPETQAGHRPGYFRPEDCSDRVSLLTSPVSPWPLLEGAVGVYCYSSQMGFEAILAGHKPRVFGQPFYAGWGLTRDERPVARRERDLSRAQLFAGAMILAPTWYDPYRDALCDLETVIDILDARARAWRDDKHGWVASGMRLWKRAPLQQAFGQEKPVVFRETPSAPRRHMIWAAHGRAEVQVEDGFLRSRGLGASLTPPLSLVLDDLGIYYDPSQESRLERLLAAAAHLRSDQLQRAARLRHMIVRAHLSKYNIGGTHPTLPEGHRILIPGQVEDDASILKGTDGISANRAMLKAVRDANPKAVLLYKPHPDVEAGLRRGAVPDAREIADCVLSQADPAKLLHDVQEVWTMTSLLGFEALVRDVPVTTFGAPFYAGWGLTQDLGTPPTRRQSTLTLDQLVHATLIAYPRYFDPVTKMPCPPEIVVHRLQTGNIPRAPFTNRMLSKAQGLLASYAHLWR